RGTELCLARGAAAIFLDHAGGARGDRAARALAARSGHARLGAPQWKHCGTRSTIYPIRRTRRIVGSPSAIAAILFAVRSIRPAKRPGGRFQQFGRSSIMQAVLVNRQAAVTIRLLNA